jgi:hypothetical protein
LQGLKKLSDSEAVLKNPVVKPGRGYGDRYPLFDQCTQNLEDSDTSYAQIFAKGNISGLL